MKNVRQERVGAGWIYPLNALKPYQ